MAANIAIDKDKVIEIEIQDGGSYTIIVAIFTQYILILYFITKRSYRGSNFTLFVLIEAVC